MARSSLFAPAIPDADPGVKDDPGLPGDPLEAFAPLAADPAAGLATGDGVDDATAHPAGAALKLGFGLGVELWRDDALTASRDALAIDVLHFTHDDDGATPHGAGAFETIDTVAASARGLEIAFAAPDGRAADPAQSDLGGDVAIDLGGSGGEFAKGGGSDAKAPAGGGSSGVVTNYFSGSGNGTAGYDIWIEFKGSNWTSALQQAFKNAADYLTSVITDDIGGGGVYRGKLIDDLYVTASLATIDGTGGVLGQAGPSAVWSVPQLTAAGQMQFDVADATNYLGRGLWDDIVTHEMMHVLGFGTLWEYGTRDLVNGFQYVGANGVAAYEAFKNNTNLNFVPVEDGGGPGTAGGHWDEQSLVNELMTGYINDDGNAATTGDNFLSKFSVMSLADLGYAVSYKDYPYDNYFT